jgi:multidrug efflux pump subunit AcrA (membrane-fusion protein)
MSATLPYDDARESSWLRAMLATLRRVAAERDAAAVAALLRELLLDHVGERARCLFHDPSSGCTWSTEDDAVEVPPGEALVGAAVSTGRAVCLDRAGDDRRHRPALDDPEGDARSRLLIQPVAEPGGPVHAVLVVARSARSPAFDGAARRRVAELARRAAPLLDQLSLQLQLDVDELATEPEPRLDTGPYRPEAVAAYAQRREHGEVVRLASPWIAWSYRLLVLLMAMGLAYVCLVHVGDYAVGPAVVRLGGRVEVTAVAGGSVVEIMVRSGEEVGPGQALVRLHDAESAAELRRLELELDVELRNLLRDPSDEAARRAVTSLRGQQERTALRGQEHVLRAPSAGVVQDVRARVGQAIEPGDVLLSVVGEQLEPHVVALLPGDDRPRLQEGAPLRLELDGYADAPQALWVDEVHADVVSPTEALRLLGAAVGEGLVLDGPVVLIRARLPAEGFESKGQRYRHHDGMRGRAEVRVRSTTILEALVPALERR